jgi:hypothetical protein
MEEYFIFRCNAKPSEILLLTHENSTDISMVAKE